MPHPVRREVVTEARPPVRENDRGQGGKVIRMDTTTVARRKILDLPVQAGDRASLGMIAVEI